MTEFNTWWDDRSMATFVIAQQAAAELWLTMSVEYFRDGAVLATPQGGESVFKLR